MKDSGLRGRGGAGFPTGQKWSFVPMGPDAPHPKYLVVNADEMEPGTFKDRLLMEGDPHQLVEGVILSAYAVEADVAYIFLRWAYTLAAERLERAIADAYDARYLGRHIFGSDLQPRAAPARQRRSLHLRRGDRAAERARRQARESAIEAAVPRRVRPLGQADGRQQRRDDLQRPAHRVEGGGLVQEGEPHRRGRHEAVRRERTREAARASGSCPSARRCARSWTNTPAACRTA